MERVIAIAALTEGQFPVAAGAHRGGRALSGKPGQGVELRQLQQGIRRVRSTLPSRRIARLLFFVHEGRLGVVHGFIKKTQKTPPDDLALARKRMQEMTT